MERFCYQDKQRVCNKNCVAFHEGEDYSVFYGIDSRGNLMTGCCLILGLQAMLINELGKLRELLDKKRRRKNAAF
jgi:hypothetical protein